MNSWVADTMKNDLKSKRVVLICCAFILSCRANVSPTPPQEEIPPTSTRILPTETPIAVTPSLTMTPAPLSPEIATLAAIGTICTEARRIDAVEISPDGKWIAAACYWENDKEDSPLQVVSLDGVKNWKIYFSRYKVGEVFDRHDEVRPYRWSKDGKFVFATVGSRVEGCCWIGHRYVLLVQLNLETGEQVALLNTDYDSADAFDFIISDDDRYLLFSPTSDQPYDFAILDFQTGKIKEIFLKFQEEVDVAYAKISPKADKVILPLFKNQEFNDYSVDSIVIVDLITGKQNVLISDLTPEDELFPIRWLDDSRVLFTNVNPVYSVNSQEPGYWLLDISSGQLEKQQSP